jgi:hypothetical protein
VLSGAGLRDDPLLAHPPGQQGLPEHVAHLVRARVVEVLALEQDPGAHLLGQPDGVVEHRGQPRVVAQQRGELALERLVGHCPPVLRVKLVEGRNQRLRHEAAAEPAEMSRGVRQRPRIRQRPGVRRAHRVGLGVAGWLPAVTNSATASRGLF